MDEQQQFRELLNAVRTALPNAVVATCESLNEHGEWEEALGHCLYYLDGVELPPDSAALVEACRVRFQAGKPAKRPNRSSQRTGFAGR